MLIVWVNLTIRISVMLFFLSDFPTNMDSQKAILMDTGAIGKLLLVVSRPTAY